MFIRKLYQEASTVESRQRFLARSILFSRIGINRGKKDVPLTLAISGARVITRERNCYIMDPWGTNKRCSTDDGRKRAGRRRGRYARHHPGPTIGGIKSGKERWLVARGAESDEVERNRGAKEADTIHNGLGEPARRSNVTPTEITDVHNRRETASVKS